MKKFYTLIAVAALAFNAFAAPEFIPSDGFKYTAKLLTEEPQAASLTSILVSFDFSGIQAPEGVTMVDPQILIALQKGSGLKWTDDNEWEDLINYEDYLEGWGVTRANRLNMLIGKSVREDVVETYGDECLVVIGAHTNLAQRVMPASGNIFEGFIDASGAEDGVYDILIPCTDSANCSIAASDGNSYYGTEDFVLQIEKKGDEVIPPTGIETVETAKSVKAVKYYNLAGVESAQPFDGVNIVVKEYTDGSRAASKIVK